MLVGAGIKIVSWDTWFHQEPMLKVQSQWGMYRSFLSLVLYLWWLFPDSAPLNGIHPQHGPQAPFTLLNLFISSGDITPAEFLPESASLLHLDLTMNNTTQHVCVMWRGRAEPHSRLLGMGVEGWRERSVHRVIRIARLRVDKIIKYIE